MKSKDYFEVNKIAYMAHKTWGVIPLANSVTIICAENSQLVVGVERKEDSNQVCFPGGKQEVGENSLDAAIRETYEETGIQLNKDQLIPIYSGVCESQDDIYWVTNYLVILPYNIPLNSPEPEMKPSWLNRAEFMKRSSYKEYNSQVFNIINNFI